MGHLCAKIHRNPTKEFALVWSIPQSDCLLLNVVEVGRDEKVMRMVRGGESGWDMMQPRAAWLRSPSRRDLTEAVQKFRA